LAILENTLVAFLLLVTLALMLDTYRLPIQVDRAAMVVKTTIDKKK
jgi:hypothetical protein